MLQISKYFKVNLMFKNINLFRFVNVSETVVFHLQDKLGDTVIESLTN